MVGAGVAFSASRFEDTDPLLTELRAITPPIDSTSSSMLLPSFDDISCMGITSLKGKQERGS